MVLITENGTLPKSILDRGDGENDFSTPELHCLKKVTTDTGGVLYKSTEHLPHQSTYERIARLLDITEPIVDIKTSVQLFIGQNATKEYPQREAVSLLLQVDRMLQKSILPEMQEQLVFEEVKNDFISHASSLIADYSELLSLFSQDEFAIWNKYKTRENMEPGFENDFIGKY